MIRRLAGVRWRAYRYLVTDPTASPPTAPLASFRLSGIVVPVRLGWTAGERAEPQPVGVDLEIRFVEPPPACRTDDLADTVDYGALPRLVADVAAAGEVRLIERLCRAIYDAVRAQLPRHAGLDVSVTKRPPLPGVEGGAVFRLRDWR